jgi:hypothetical protein
MQSVEEFYKATWLEFVFWFALYRDKRQANIQFWIGVWGSV